MGDDSRAARKSHPMPASHHDSQVKLSHPEDCHHQGLDKQYAVNVIFASMRLP
jgi:hypothetical protein